VVQATKSGAVTTFKYDRLNRQIEQLAGSTTTQWEMDFADRRALQKEGAVETQYQWDGIRLQSESNSAGVISSTYRWGSELIGQASGYRQTTWSDQSRRLYLFEANWTGQSNPVHSRCAILEHQAPTIQSAHVARAIVIHAQLPNAVCNNGCCVYGKASNNIISTAAGTIPQIERGAIGCDQVHF
jgi:hypothetical protein